MRHMMMILSLLLVAQGSALADGMPDVPPPPEMPAGASCPAPTDSKEYKELQTALTSSEDDVKALLENGCDKAKVQDICAKHPDWAACKPPAPKPTTTATRKVVKRPPAKHPDAPKKPNADAPPSYVDFDKIVVPGRVGAHCVRLTKWTDRNRNLKHDDGETVQVDQICDGRDGKNGLNGRDGKNGHDGRDGSSGRPGRDGDTRVEFGLGMRTSAIWSKGRPTGYSAAPEASLELWLAPTVEFVSGVAWAPDGDRNMVVTGQIRYRALGKRLGIGLGVQYQAWNLLGNQALWQSVMGLGGLQLVLVETSHVDISFEAGFLSGLDGYDTDAQLAIGGTGQVSAALKF